MRPPGCLSMAVLGGLRGLEEDCWPLPGWGSGCWARQLAPELCTKDKSDR